MNKLLAVFVMLCLPMAVVGETYVCEPEKVSSVFDVDVTVTDLPSIVIDLDRGTRLLREGREYGGSCEKSEFEIICVRDDSDIGNFSRTVLTLEDAVFTSAIQYIFAGLQGIVAQYGKCTEI